MKADCLKCVYFIPASDLEGWRYNKIMEMRKRGEPAWGWCVRKKGVVTYLTGYCRFFKPKEEDKEPVGLEKFLG